MGGVIAVRHGWEGVDAVASWGGGEVHRGGVVECCYVVNSSSTNTRDRMRMVAAKFTLANLYVGINTFHHAEFKFKHYVGIWILLNLI